MKTIMANSATVEKKWYIIDAEGKVLGRVAAEAATLLRGKHKATFTPNVDCGDNVIILNSDKLVLTGKKEEQKYFKRYSGFTNGLKEIQYKDLLAKKSDFAVYEAIRGMLPKNRLGRKMIKHVRVYKDAVHGHEAQKPVKIELKGKRV